MRYLVLASFLSVVFSLVSTTMPGRLTTSSSCPEIVVVVVVVAVAVAVVVVVVVVVVW